VRDGLRMTAAEAEVWRPAPGASDALLRFLARIFES